MNNLFVRCGDTGKAAVLWFDVKKRLNSRLLTICFLLKIKLWRKGLVNNDKQGSILWKKEIKEQSGKHKREWQHTYLNYILY